jgi:hypothetical protein
VWVTTITDCCTIVSKSMGFCFRFVSLVTAFRLGVGTVPDTGGIIGRLCRSIAHPIVLI